MMIRLEEKATALVCYQCGWRTAAENRRLEFGERGTDAELLRADMRAMTQGLETGLKKHIT